MKYFNFILFLLLLAILGIFLIFQRHTVVTHIRRSISLTPPAKTTSIPEIIFCTPKQVQAMLTTQGAAGNIYGTLTIKNISSFPCTIQSNQFINASFTEGNILVVDQGQKGPPTLSLTPNQTVYSQIHYPNGPQCSGQTQQTPITFHYAISPTGTIVFTPNGNLPATIPTCTTGETTQLDVWSISTKPVQ